MPHDDSEVEAEVRDRLVYACAKGRSGLTEAKALVKKHPGALAHCNFHATFGRLEGMTPLCAASESGRGAAEVVEFLLDLKPSAAAGTHAAEAAARRQAAQDAELGIVDGDAAESKGK